MSSLSACVAFSGAVCAFGLVLAFGVLSCPSLPSGVLGVAVPVRVLGPLGPLAPLAPLGPLGCVWPGGVVCVDSL